MSAHPRLDRHSGELMNLAYNLETGCANYTRFDKDRKLLNRVEVKLLNPRMIHDLQFTDDYVIIADLPLEFDPGNALSKGCGVFQFNPKGAARYGFLKKDASDDKEIIWVNCDAHACFHFTNAYQEGNKVFMHGCLWDDMNFDFRTEYPDEIIGDGPWLKSMNFDLTKKELVIEKMNDIMVDFPLVNPFNQGRNYRYVYMFIFPQGDNYTREEARDVHGKGFLKFDVQKN